MTRQSLHDEFRKLMFQYLDTDTANPVMYIREITRLVDTANENRKYAEELGTEAIGFFDAVYNYYRGFIELSDGRVTAAGVKERSGLREREVRTVRYVKGLFRKGMEFGSEYPC